MTYDEIEASLYKYAHDKYGDKFDTLPKSRKHYILMEELMRQLRSDEPDTKEMRKSKLAKDSSLKNNVEFEEIEKIEPLDVLKMRLAQGEISLEEFNKIKQHLE